MTIDRMQRPIGMYDGDWADFEYELGQAGWTLEDFAQFLLDSDSTLADEWGKTNSRSHASRGIQLVLAMDEHMKRKWQWSRAVPLADELASRLIDPLLASMYADELAELLVDEDNERLRPLLRDAASIADLADEALQSTKVERLVKSFLFDKLHNAPGAP